MSFFRLAVVAPLVFGLVAVVGVDCTPASEPLAAESLPSAADLQLQQYVYVDFPRQLQALDNETALAEHFVILQQQRVSGYQPFRSFHQYGATYFVDQSAQLQLLAAQQELACLYQRKADLWRERQAIVQMLLPAPPSGGD